MKVNLRLSRNLPVLGIVAFSLASVWSLYNLFTGSAQHPSPVLWGPAVLVELVTAWLVYTVVGLIRKVLLSNIAKQDRKFYAVLLAVNLLLIVPTLGASVWANALEFQSIVLGSLFPVASIACAIAVAIPDVLERHEQAKARERQDAESERKRKESERQAAQARAQADARQRQETDNLLASLGKARQVYDILAQEPGKSLSSIGQDLSISRQAVGQHVDKLMGAGLVRKNGHGLEVTR